MTRDPNALEPGISFSMRCRDEEDYLLANLKSLQGLTIPYEVVVVLNRSTDASEGILLSLQSRGFPIRIYRYDIPVSKTGFENLVTDRDSPHSWVRLHEIGLERCRKRWFFHWDADSRCPPRLLDFLNSLDPEEERKVVYRMTRRRENGKGIPYMEDFLSNAIAGFMKFLYWENRHFLVGTERIWLPEEIYIENMEPADHVKDYRREPPWFSGTGSIEEKRYKLLMDLMGPEVPGMAYPGNPDEILQQTKLMGFMEELEKNGIIFEK